MRPAPRWHKSIDRLGVPPGYAAALAPLAPHIAALARGRRLRVLDCGIGTGQFSAAIAAQSLVPIKVTGTDVSPAILAAARERLSVMDCTLDGHVVDGHPLPFDAGQFDVVLSAHRLEHMRAPGAALLQMHRVLRPGGMVIVALTRRSLASVPLQLMWRVRTFTPARASALLTASGFCGRHVLPPAGPALFQRLTLFAVGRKSLQF
ncbi:MAG: class I SAM-dependent methyltransferase [Pseudomonadota bacterium]